MYLVFKIYLHLFSAEYITVKLYSKKLLMSVGLFLKLLLFAVELRGGPPVYLVSYNCSFFAIDSALPSSVACNTCNSIL